ncbi:MAG: tyrosine-protein kinase [Actinomycetota bacterium]|jgi:receptor protein-tyrosine kinase|nr:tyrosine-protein kinase [Actinomycetota bacterium]
MGIGRLLEIAWRRWLVVVVVLVVVVAAAGWQLSTQPDIYESRAKIALLPDSANPQLVPFYSQAVDSLLPTYAQIVESRSFLDHVASQLPFPATSASIGGSIRAVPVARVGVLDVVGSSHEPQRAQQLAETTAKAFVERLAGNGILTVTMLDDARVPVTPAKPKPKLVYGVAVLLGLLFGGLGAVGWDRYFGRVNSVADLQALTSVAVLAVLPEVRQLRRRRVVLGDPALIELEESLRSLRTNVFFATSDIGKGTTIITGLSPGDGKSTVAANLAVMTAELGLSVVLVDGDVHRPSQHEIFGLPNDVGLSSTVLDGVPAASLPLPTIYPNLRVVTAGPPLSSRAEELRLYLEALPTFGELAEVVLVDSPPIRAADEVRILAAFSARVVLLVRAGSVTGRQVEQAIESLRQVGATLLGLVLARGKSREVNEAIRYYRDYRREVAGDPAAPAPAMVERRPPPPRAPSAPSAPAAPSSPDPLSSPPARDPDWH